MVPRTTPEPARPPDSGPEQAVVLIELDALMIDGADGPRPLDEASDALARIGLVGTAVVLAPASLRGRPLPQDTAAKIDLVRRLLGDPALDVVEGVAVPDGRRDVDDATHVWQTVVEATTARWLVTAQALVIAPARRSGLRVVLIGASGSSPQAAIEPAEHEARDLLDAIGHILTAETFAIDAIA
jgi:hypothetical protein